MGGYRRLNTGGPSEPEAAQDVAPSSEGQATCTPSPAPGKENVEPMSGDRASTPMPLGVASGDTPQSTVKQSNGANERSLATFSRPPLSDITRDITGDLNDNQFEIEMGKLGKGAKKSAASKKGSSSNGDESATLLSGNESTGAKQGKGRRSSNSILQLMR